MEKQPAPLRYGYTTGSCATAATRAALLALITQQQVMSSTITLPAGQEVAFTMETCEFTRDMATAGTIKDGGDDPDATHGALIVSTVSWSDKPGIDLDGGVGVGRVTKPGLPIAVGLAAINPVPRRMIAETAEAVLAEYGIQQGVRVVISVPTGEEVAKKTLNSRLGILGGISILGTRGIVVPFSTSAYKASIVQAINVAVVSGADHLVLATGGRSEKIGMELYPGLQEDAFIEMGDFVGFSLLACKRHPQVRKITLVGMMGKFSKVAQGVMMVHSKGAAVDFDFLAQIAVDTGVPEEWVEQIRSANTASQVGEWMQEQGYHRYFDHISKLCCEAGLQEVKGGVEIETVIATLKGEILGRMSIVG